MPHDTTRERQTRNGDRLPMIENRCGGEVGFTRRVTFCDMREIFRQLAGLGDG